MKASYTRLMRPLGRCATRAANSIALERKFRIIHETRFVGERGYFFRRFQKVDRIEIECGSAFTRTNMQDDHDQVAGYDPQWPDLPEKSGRRLVF